MRRYSGHLRAALGLSVVVAACSDGSEEWLARTRGANTASSGSDSGSIAGASGEMPPPGGGSGATPGAGSASTPTAGSGSDSTGGTGIGGGGTETGGTAPVAGSTTGGSESTGGSAFMGGSGGVGGSGGDGGASGGPFKVLVISTSLEFPHDSIGECQKMVKDLGAAETTNGWSADLETDDLPHFVAGGLKDYALIFSCNPTGRVFSGNPQVKDKPGAMKAFQDFIETDGKAFAGVHSASDFEKTNGFPWFTNVLMGAYFNTHDSDGTSGSVVSDAQNTAHPVLTGLSGNYSTKDEWYKMNRDPGSQPGFKILQRLASDSRPLTWVKDVGAGRMFYTVRGHAKSVFSEVPFRAVVKNGILWTTRRID
jgi:type 1 glutamine amidotransferase